MKNELKFNSQICTTYKQSQRLLEIGLKPETADCQYAALVIDWKGNTISSPKWRFYDHNKGFIVQNFERMERIPAWSLNRLIEMLPKIIHINQMQWYLSITPYYNDMVAYEHCGNMESNYLYKSFCGNIYDNIITCIEWLTDENDFNKEYLKQ